ncbi:MAG: hypothetical protein LBQ54_09865 [Planctomycetaceae bacterium]|jgi:hypothetical protein|nr:hypothetical protein [Planctomycetaceae bacterium]
MKKTIMFMVFCAAVLTAVSTIGCKKDNRPEDMPPLFSCVITVVLEGTPLDEAAVSFVPVEGTDAKYRAVGVTNAEGKATMKTYGFDGAPAGKYKVTVRKLVVEEGPTITNSDGEEVTAHGAEYQAVERKYMDAKTTPHEIEITAGKKTHEVTFDVGKAIKIR